MPNVDLQEQQLLAVAIKRLARLAKQHSFDPSKEDSRPTAAQLAILQDTKVRFQYVVAGNRTGKSQLGARIATWLFTDTHPYWTRPADWGDEPLLLIIIGRVMQQVTTELWDNKMKLFLDPADYREVRIGGQVQKVINVHNGNTMLFMSHDNEREAREKAQAYTAHFVWLDEMCQSIRLIEELHQRVETKRGQFLATFTPKIRSDEIRCLVDACSLPLSKKYRLAKLDNPVYYGHEEEVLSAISMFSKEMQATMLYGDWYSGDNAVISTPSSHWVENPEDYDTGWPHVECVDPASNSATGLVLFAKRPGVDQWYVVHSSHVPKGAPTELLNYLEVALRKYNIVRRVADTHESWFINEAAKRGRHYLGVVKKTERFADIIMAADQALSSGRVKVAPWCTQLRDELLSAQWAETAVEKIIGGSRLHCFDAFKYGIDILPLIKNAPRLLTPNELLVKADNLRRDRVALARSKLNEARRIQRGKRWR